jgi:uncharacterized membrane protein
MPRTTFAGHPTHPILVAFPIGMLGLGCFLDFWNAASSDERREYAAQVSHTAGVFSSVAAATTGLLDYLALPRERGLRRTGLVHGLLNVGLLGVSIANIWAHSNRKSAAVKVALSSVELGIMTVSQWYGAELIYGAGVRVAGIDPTKDSAEFKLPDDDAIRNAFAQVASPNNPERAA